MADKFLPIGVSTGSTSLSQLKGDLARRTHSAVVNNKAFSLIDICTIDEGESEILIVDCECDAMASKRVNDVRYRERLALRFYTNADKMPEVRALRDDFPDASVTTHQNCVAPGEPKSLCLYLESWGTLRRTWTPEKHLHNVVSWLVNAASGQLHPQDQAVEPVFFEGHWHLILPYDFDEKKNDSNFVLTVARSNADINLAPANVLLCGFQPSNHAGDSQYIFLTIEMPAVAHGTVATFPRTMGQLADQLKLAGADLYTLIFNQLELKLENGVHRKSPKANIGIISEVPICRHSGDPVERVDKLAFFVNSDFGTLGEAAGLLLRSQGGTGYVPNLAVRLNCGVDTNLNRFRELGIEQVECIDPLSAGLARSAANLEDSSPISGILAGVGALGSALLDIWHRERWAKWTIIDHDYLKPHNLVRHTSTLEHLGMYKVAALNYAHQWPEVGVDAPFNGIVANGADFAKSEIVRAMGTAHLFVDATATVELGRDLGTSAAVNQRCASVFLTPSGSGSVLLMEDEQRTIRIDALEAQYYGAVLKSDWGVTLLTSSNGTIRAGRGCRDISVRLSPELVNLHAAILARQVRITASGGLAALRIWLSDINTGEINRFDIAPSTEIRQRVGNWSVVWNEDIRNRLRQIRSIKLPRETGGILLGYVDQYSRHIYIVDALLSPTDSIEEGTAYVRGTAGISAAVTDAKRRTSEIVGYLGEWHSHPRNQDSKPSSTDLAAIHDHAAKLAYEGLPAIMLIIGESEERIIIQ